MLFSSNNLGHTGSLCTALVLWGRSSSSIRLPRVLVASASFLLTAVGSYASQAGNPERPNILWIVSEDNGPFLGCYGDSLAVTPNLDRLAAQGVRYENAFANAPVCAPSRSTIITGMYASSLGTLHMRSTNPLPRSIRFFTQYLREAGYYCTNRHKEDYNTIKPDGAWDESSKEATWTKRAPGQPFFSVVNITTSHESSLHETVSTTHDPARMILPPYHPDTPVIRHDWAQYYDKITEMDKQVGGILEELERQGLAEETIVFYYADHGGVLTRSKRFVYDSGTRVPLLVRVPEKFKHLAPGEPGTHTDRLVGFVDLAPTILSLAGIPVPGYMQGQAFLGRQKSEPPEYVHLFRGRMDERIDLMRAVRSTRFKYIRNYLPHRVYAQHLDYLWKMPTTRSWEAEYRAGRVTEVQRRFFETKPTEELYDVETDPHEVNNLARDPAYARVLGELRAANRQRILETRDPTFLPEAEMVIRSGGGSPYDMARNATAYNLPRILATAELAGEMDPGNLTELQDLLEDTDSGVRYWAAQGLIALGTRARPAEESLHRALGDSSPDVRISAAEALAILGHSEKVLPVLREAMQDPNEYVRLHAINVIDHLDEKARTLLPVLENANNDDSEYVRSVAIKALEDLRDST
jgi:arylsulfatase A-like enzyme